MATVSEPTAPPAATPVPREPGRSLHRISIDQYSAMWDAGILTRNDRVELVEGLLVEKMERPTPHIIGAAHLGDFIQRVVPKQEYFRGAEATIAIPREGRDSLPEPDWIVADRAVWTYRRGRRIGPQDVLVTFEVSDTSLPADRTLQKSLYAWAGIPTYWILNIPDRQVEVYTLPSGPAAVPDYGRRETFREDQEVALVIAGRKLGRVAVRELHTPAEGAG